MVVVDTVVGAVTTGELVVVAGAAVVAATVGVGDVGCCDGAGAVEPPSFFTNSL